MEEIPEPGTVDAELFEVEIANDLRQLVAALYERGYSREEVILMACGVNVDQLGRIYTESHEEGN